MKITNDEQYFKSLQWLTERAAKIEAKDVEMKNPLVPKEQKEAWSAERAKLMVNYDLVEAECRKYRSGLAVDEPQPKKTALDNFFD
jgi:hypothetical protein